jgi:hydrogenase nickel incorporation protein HypA/HybF
MHEMGIANSVLHAVRTEVARYPGAIPCVVGLKVGELAAIDADALRFCFDALIRDTDLASLRLAIELCPRRHRCAACGLEFAVHDYEFQCPGCAVPAPECIGGDELELAYIEVDDHEPSAVGKESSQ